MPERLKTIATTFVPTAAISECRPPSSHCSASVVAGLPASVGSTGVATTSAVFDVFLVTFPFFALYFALPCMLFRFGAGTPIARIILWTTVAAFFSFPLAVGCLR